MLFPLGSLSWVFCLLWLWRYCKMKVGSRSQVEKGTDGGSVVEASKERGLVWGEKSAAQAGVLRFKGIPASGRPTSRRGLLARAESAAQAAVLHHVSLCCYRLTASGYEEAGLVC